MKKIHMIAALLAMLLPTVLWAGGDSTTYYAALKAQVSSNSSGMGKVYAGTSNSAPSASSYNASSSQTSAQESETQNSTKDLYAFALPNDGYEFVGWSRSNNGTDLGKGTAVGDAYRITAKVTFNSESSPNAQTWYATFKEKVLDAFSITFETSANGTYTVDGSAPANKIGLTKATSVVLASSDSNFLNWNINGTVVNNNPYTLSCTENTTVSADFLTADQVTSVTTLSDLTSALSNAAYKKIIVPSGTSITVAKGSTVTVPAGKQLVIDGTLVVVGTVSNSGVISGSGTLYKISYLIDQGELQILYQADGTECSTISGTAHHAGESAHYYKTQAASNTPSVSGGTISVSSKWGVLLNGETPYEISAQSVKGVRVNIDKTIAANKITSITGSLTSTDIQSGETGNSANWVLFSNCSLKGPARSGETTRLNFNGTIDLCGYTLTFGLARTYSDFYGVFLNGKINFTPSTDFQNGGSIFFNCSSINITKIKGTPTMLFYDCGTAASPATLSFSYQSSAHRNARIYSGYYSYTFNSSYDNGYAKVYGGSFSSDPSSYLADIDKLEAVKSGSYWVVQEKKEVVNVVQIGATPYETLEAAVNAAVAGDTISLIERVELTGTTTIPSGKNITITLDGHTLTGGKIVNNGTLVFTDSTTGKGTAANEASGGKVESDIENTGNGTLDFVFGTYSGAIVNKSGTLTTHNGLFTGTISKQGGAVNLKGGHFSTDVETLATVENTKVFFENSLYSVCELLNGTMYSETLSGNSGYGVTPYIDDDFALVKDWFGNKNARTSYTATQWKRLAELLCFYQLFNNNGLDATLAFDRDVTAKSLNLYAKSSLTLQRELKFDLAAGQYYRALSETLIGNGYYAKTYKALWDDNIKSVATAVSDKTGNNAGTVCAAMIEVWTEVRDADYGHNGLKHTNTVFIAARKLFTLGAGSNKAMIRPATGAADFYATLGAAMDAAADGGTVMLANDCDTALPLNKAGTYTFDTMGFAASDAVSVSGGLFVKSETAVDSSAKVLVPDAKATTYVVAQKVASVGGTFYDNLTEAVGAANGEVVTLLAATDETITLGEGQTLSLNKNGIAFDDAKVVTSVEGSSVKATTAEGVTVYSLVKDVVTSGEAHYPSIEAAIEAAEGNTVAVTVVAADTETIDLDAGKTLVVTVADGVEANVTVDPGEGAFIDATTDGNTTTYESKKITVEMATPQATVEVKKIDHGTESTVTDTTEIDAAVTQLMGNHDVPRTDNTDKLDVLDKITVTPTKIVEEVADSKTIIRSATFDVVPAFKTGQSLTAGQKLKFRLPVDAAATQLAAVVYHGDAQFGIYPVQTYNDEKYIEVESDTFSPYGYELLDGETANPIAAIGTTGYATLPDAIAAASNGDTITVFAGTFDIGSDTIVVNKQVTITGAGKDTTTLNSTATGKAAISIQSNNVTIENMTINQADKTASNTTHIQIGSKSAVVENVTVQDVKFTGSKYSLSVYAKNLTVDSCDFVEPGSDAILLYTVQGTSAISDNTFVQTSPNGQGFIYGTTSDGTDPLSSGTLTISGNTATAGRCFYHCNNQNRIDTTTKLTLTITDNEIIGYNNKAIVFAGHNDIPLGNIFNSITITENAFYTNAKRPTIQRDDTDKSSLAINASGNYWGAATPDFENVIPGTTDKYLIVPSTDNNVIVDSYYQAYDENTDTLSNLYTVPRVAQNKTTGVKYESLAAAVAAATSGDTIEMLADDRLSEELAIDRSVTITGAVDSEGKPLYTIYGKPTDNYNVDIFVKNASSAIDVTIQNVNISEFGHQYKTSTGNAALYVSRSTHADTHVLVSNVTFSAYNNYAIIAPQGHLEVVDCAINGYKDSSYGTFATGGIWSGDMFDDLPSSTVSVVRTSIINTDSNMPGVTGYAIDARAGSTVTVTDCMITNVHDGIAAAASQESGSGDASVSVSGTTVTASRNALAITGNPQIANTVLAFLEVKSGMFAGAVTIPDEFVDDGIIEISGGIFDDEVPEEYCASGFIPAANTDAETSEAYPYTVKEGSYVAQIVRNNEVIAKYEAFAAALEDAQSGDTVQLLADVEDVTETFVLHGKNITIDGQGLYSITAGENTEPRSVVQSYGVARNMFVVQSGNVTFKDITLDGGETHYYTFLVQAKNGTTTFDNVSLLHGGEADTSGTAGVGYGAAVQVDGATVLVTNSFYACTGTNVNNVTTGVFPFTALLYQAGGIHFYDGVTAGIGDDLLLVGMVGAVDVSTDAGREMVSEMLEAMNVPAGYYPYTLKLGDSEMTSFTGASPLGWNGIIDYGKEIMTTTSSLGMEMDPATTPVEVGLLTDTVLPDTFRFADTNFTVNGNGNALAGTIEYTDNAGQIHDIVMGTEGNALVLDMTDTTKPIVIGSGITVSNVTVQMTAEQAKAGTPVIIWDAAHGVDAPENEQGVTVQIVDDHGDSTGVTKELIWDDEMGMAYIGPCEARLTGPTHDKPIYTSLAAAIELAAQTGGDTVTLLMNVTNVTTTYEISKQDLVIDGAGYSVAAAPVTEHRNMFEAWGGSKNMFKLQTGNITFRNITLDGDETHAYTFLISADNSSVALTTENVRLIHGGEISEDSNNATVTPGNGYGAAIHLNNGAQLVVSNGFYACTGTNVNGVTTGVFPFTAILPENLEAGTSVAFKLTGDPNDPANVDIGDDLLLVGMIGDLIDQYGIATVQGILDYMKVPSRFIPYTLTLADGSAYAFTGASPRRWNEIIDYGKDIMDVATANGFSGLNKDTTPVEVGLATDTILPAGNADDGYDFLYEDSNFSINGNGNALSGTIKFTDDAKGGLMHDIDLGTDDAPLTLDLSVTTNAVMLGGDVIISNVVVKLTEDQATLGRVVFEWDSGETPPDDEQGVEVTVVDNSGTPTGETKGLIWDEEYGIAFIGPVEARLTGPTHEVPIYTTLADAIARAAASGDKVTLMTNVTLSACQTIDKSIEFSLNGQALAASGDAISVASGAAVQMFSEGTVTGNIAVVSGTLTITNGIYVGGLSKADGDGAKFVISGGYFRDPVLQEYCADGYSPVKTTASKYAATPYTVARVEIVYPTGKTDGGLDTVGVPIPLAWINSNTDLVGEDGLVLEELDQIVTDLGDAGTNGVPLWQSYVLGLDPNDATSQLRLEGLPATSDEKVTIRGLNINVPAILESQGTTVGFHLEEAEPGSDSWTVRSDACTMAEGLPTFTVPLSTVDGKVLRIVADIKTRSK